MCTKIAEGLFHKLTYFWQTLPFKKSKAYHLAGHTLLLEFISKEILEKMEKALEHLQDDQPIGVPLKIRLVETSKFPFHLTPEEGALLTRNNAQGSIFFPLYLHYIPEIQALSVINLEQNTAYYLVKDASKLPWWVSGAPLQVIFSVLLKHQGIQLAHSAAVGNKDGAALLFGKGGSGKSTTTLSCLSHAMYGLGEDYCALELGQTPLVHSLYQSAKLTRDTVSAFPQTGPFHEYPDRKQLVYFQDLFPKQMKRALKLKALVHLQIGHDSLPCITPISKKEALSGLLLSTLYGLPLYEKKTITLLSGLTEKLPCFRLSLGRDFQANVETISSLI